MGLYAFRRLREREAASTEVASLSMPEPPELKLVSEVKTDGNRNRGDRRRGKRQFLPDAS